MSSPGPPSWPHALSGAALDVDPPTGPDADTPELDDPARYVLGGLLGRGGMGEVRLVWDARLGREVAEKTILNTESGAARRLLREATVTARLEHPSIVPVYDAGRTADGRPCYRMRLVRGRSLAERLADTPEMRARLQTLRGFLQACEAIAYAHARGILHRDLKPANLMLGERGETLVVDWGLACELDTHGRGPAETVGTTGYMAPEQAAGSVLDVRADIWSLGAVLHFILAGTPPPATGPTLPPDAPAPLAAIAARALQPRPDQRYSTADELADDLAAWFEGRRVAAYHTTPWRTLGRMVRVWRVPLAVAAVGVVLVVGAVAHGWSTTLAERNHALQARRTALAERDRARRALGSSLVSQARIAEDQDDQRRAELLAVDALRHLPGDPDALGVLAQFSARARPTRVAHHPLPGCRALALSADAGRVACVAGEAVTLHDRTTGEVVPLVGPADQVGFAGPGGAVLGLHGGRVLRWDDLGRPSPVASGVAGAERITAGNHPQRSLILGHGNTWELSGETATAVDPCVGATGASHLAATSDGGLVAGCTDGRVTLTTSTGELRSHTLPATSGPVMALAAAGRGTELRVAVGTVSGHVHLLDHRLERLETHPFDGGAVRRLALSPDRLAVATARGWVEVLRLGESAPPVRLPGPALAIAWTDAGTRLHVVSHDAATTWSLVEPGPPDHFALGAGVASLTVEARDRLWAATLGDGRVVVVGRDGAVGSELRLHDSVAKDAAFAPSGRRLAVGHATRPALDVIDLSTGTSVRSWAVPKVRRLAWVAGGPLLVAAYAPGLLAFDPETGAPVPLDGVEPTLVVDLESTTDGRGAVVLDTLGTVSRLHPSAPTELRRVAVLPTGVAVAATPDTTLVAHRDAVTVISGTGRRRLELGVHDVLEVATSPGGDRFATAHLDGQVRVWATADGRLLARLRGHQARTVALAFRDGGRSLLSGSWDGSVRSWSLQALDLAVEELAGTVEAAWGTDATSLLDPSLAEPAAPSVP